IIYDNIKVSEFVSQNQQPSVPVQLMKKKGNVLQKSLSLLTRRNSISNSNLLLNEKQNFSISKFENDYDVALDLEYSIMTLANIKIELSSYLCIDQPESYDLSYSPDEISYNNSSESLNHQNSQKIYHNSPLAVQNYDFTSNMDNSNNNEIIVEDNNKNDKVIINNKEKIQQVYDEKSDDFYEQKKPKKSIDNSEIIQMLYKHKNNEYIEIEKEKVEKKSKLINIKSPLLGRGRGSFLSVTDPKVTSSVVNMNSCNNMNSLTYIDLKNTQNMLSPNIKHYSNEDVDSHINYNSNNNSPIDIKNENKKDIIQKNNEGDLDYIMDEHLSVTSTDIDENKFNNTLSKQNNTNKSPQLNKTEKNIINSKLVMQLKEGKMKEGTYYNKTGKYVWNGKLNTYWVVLCEDRLILFSNWKWFENNNKSERQKKDQSTIINVPKVSYVIPIINGVCVHSKFEFKGKYIFHLCIDKKDIIFEAETKESMIEWMNSINFLSSFVSANLNPLKCNKNIKSYDSLNNSITNLEKEVDMVLNEKNENSNENFELLNKNASNENNENITEKKTESNDIINKSNSNESNINDNIITKEENNNSNDKISNKGTEITSSSNVNYIEFENENLLEYYIKDVIEKYEMKNKEYLKNIQEYKKLYSQYIILSPISKYSRQKYNDQLTKIIKQIKINKILYEKYCCYDYFLKNCFEVDVTSNNNIYREIEEYESDSYQNTPQTSPLIINDYENIINNIENNKNNNYSSNSNSNSSSKENNNIIDDNTNKNDD
ncbi:hypothetical protein PIROE2DRAFT_16726, partial [Piromyces sp. E2]